jgi:hypothetical protein
MLEAGAAAQHRHDRRLLDHPGKSVHERVLAPEHDRGAQDGGVGERLAHRRLALALGPAIGGGSIRIGPDRGNMDQRLDARAGGRFGDGARAVDMGALEIAAEHADQVHHRVGPLHRAQDRVGAADIGGHQLHLADRGQGFEMPGLAGVALRHANARACVQQGLGGVAADKASAADQRHQLVLHEHVVRCRMG